ncbi:MAG TPA: hypothetical protein VEZ90_06480 [Blastocatellia bacterium]|nr:hypothetical protein [Blastocatellia bacterium]
MKLVQDYRKRISVFACAFAVLTFALAAIARADGYEFKVHNGTKTAIKKLLASEDGDKFGYFDIGDGIEPGETVKLVWSKSTDDQACHQYFKAVFADGSESSVKKFDFCESGLVLEFSED